MKLPNNIHEAIRLEYMYKSMIQNWNRKSILEQFPERVNNTEYYQMIQIAIQTLDMIREYHVLGIDPFVGEYGTKPFDSDAFDSLQSQG